MYKIPTPEEIWEIHHTRKGHEVDENLYCHTCQRDGKEWIRYAEGGDES